MTIRNRLILKMEGPEQNDHHLDLSVFATKTSQFLKFLKISAQDSGEDGVAFPLVNLSHSSPVVLECTPVSQGNQPSAVVNNVRETFDLTANKQTRALSHPVLDSLEKLADCDPKEIRQIEIHTIINDADGESVYKLDDGFKENLRDARSEEEKVISTIDGKLEQINIHKNANTFRIYSAIPNRPPVDCKFPASLLACVQQALGKFVSIRGECFYRPEVAFPYKIDVWEMEVLPASEELPTLRDLRGIAPGATGEKSSEQFVRELRDQWTQDIQ